MTGGKSRKPAANERPRVVSLRDLDGHQDCSSDDEKQTYYAGGEKSGMAVQGSGQAAESGEGAARRLMSDIFSQASSETPVRQSATQPFTGEAKRLTGETVAGRPKQREPRVVTVNLIFWRNGYTVDDGVLHSYTDPESIRFLSAIQSGNVSAEDLGVGPSDLADLKISQLPEQTFDSTIREQIIDRPKEASTSASAMSGENKKVGDVDSEIIAPDLDAKLDASVATTRIQVILPDGSRKVVTIDPRSKVAALFVKIRETTGIENFTLRTGTPPREVPDQLDACLYQIGLLNSTVIMTRK